MDIKRKQQVLPKSYLRHWIDPATEITGKTPMIWRFTKKTEILRCFAAFTICDLRLSRKPQAKIPH
jgi:hypothetical protein